MKLINLNQLDPRQMEFLEELRAGAVPIFSIYGKIIKSVDPPVFLEVDIWGSPKFAHAQMPTSSDLIQIWQTPADLLVNEQFNKSGE